MQIEQFLGHLNNVKKGKGAAWTARCPCPAHQDRTNSLSIGIGEKGILVKCHAGCDTADVVKALGLDLRDLFADEINNLSFIPPIALAGVHTTAQGQKKAGATEKPPAFAVVSSEITLADYAKAKALPIEFLTEIGLRDRKRDGKPAISIPYFGNDGQVVATRYRIAMLGDRFRWRSGAKPQLYGLWRLEDARKAGHVVIVEGESDCHAAWYHKIPAVGLPGAANWREERDAQHFAGIANIYVVVEPDTGGQAVLNWLSTSVIKDRVHLIKLGEHKDFADLHLAAGHRFDAVWQQALATALPFTVIDASNAEAEHKRAAEACSQLMEDRDILSKFAEAIAAAGVVGETKSAKLLYLALTSRFFSRPISVVLKGPSSAGKSYTTERVLKFFPEEAYYSLTAMSDRALAYSDEPLEHRFIVIFEAAGLESDFATYLLRSLLSEGCVRYETVEKTSEGMRPRLIERKGPTGCLLTTTAAMLHPENETRMLSVNVSDSRQQTRVILDRLAQEAEFAIDLEPWIALQTWLSGANHRVTIPYARELAALVPEIAVRLRRDFHHVLTLIRAHAVLHQATRDTDDKSRVTASLDDYAAAYDLIADIIAEGVEATVRLEVRQTVESVRTLLAKGGDSVTVKEVAENLHLDASTVSRRVAVARSLGYLKNEETRRRMPAKLVVGDRMPVDIEVLPHPDRLRDSVRVCTTDRGDKHTNNCADPMVEVEIS
jgi:hypothetical protein